MHFHCIIGKSTTLAVIQLKSMTPKHDHYDWENHCQWSSMLGFNWVYIPLSRYDEFHTCGSGDIFFTGIYFQKEIQCALDISRSFLWISHERHHRARPWGEVWDVIPHLIWVQSAIRLFFVYYSEQLVLDFMAYVTQSNKTTMNWISLKLTDVD